MSLPYVNGLIDEDTRESGVLLHDLDEAWPGLNFYNSRTANEAFLVDMAGSVVHRWSFPGEDSWQSTVLLSNGDILVVVKDRAILRLNRHSNLLWSFATRAHHDLWVFDGKIYALTRENRRLPGNHPELNTLDDTITILSRDGEKLESFSVLEVFRNSPFRWLLHSVSHLATEDLVGGDSENALDFLHTNHIEVFDGSLATVSPLFSRGNILISCRNINAILVLEGRTHKILWIWGPSNLTLQHHPSLLANGNMLIFDNRRRSSRILELAPLEHKIVWEYSADNFFSRKRGSVQRLPNGNTLVTESDSGHVFEITSAGEEVWRFANPDIKENGMRSAIWRMTRVAATELEFLP